MDALTARLRRAPVLAVRMALDQVRTLAGVLRIRTAERTGLARLQVLLAADRRVAELRGEDATRPTPLMVVGDAAETERLAWEAARPPRIVEATGHGRWMGHRRQI